MAMKALLEGSAGNYEIRGAVWELGAFAYRAYLHLVPAGQRPKLAGPVVSAAGMSVQEVLGAAKEQVKFATGTPVEKLAVVHRKTPAQERDTEPSALRRRTLRRHPAPTD
jgi:hypothetical protein